MKDRVDPLYWTVNAAFGSAGGPLQIQLTEEGWWRAFSVGAQVRPGQTARALAALHSVGGEAPYVEREGSRLTPSRLGREYNHMCWIHLNQIGYVAFELHADGETIRLTDDGRTACARGLAEIDSLLERIRAQEAEPIRVPTVEEGRESVERLGIDVPRVAEEIRNRIAWRTARVATFGRNLAIAGALTRSYDLGWDRGQAEGNVGRSAREWREDVDGQWSPNVNGKAAS